jgi:DNA mismatch repair protein MutS
MGRRLLRRLLDRPLYNPLQIEKRLNAVEEIKNDSMLRLDLTELLCGVFDIERLLTRIVCKTTSPRELVTFAQALGQLPLIRDRLKACRSRALCEIHTDADPLEDVAQLIFDAIAPDPPAVTKDGWFIRTGFDEKTDGLRALLTDTKGILAAIEAEERESSGIKNLKIRYNKVFGYYIEVTNSNKQMVPAHYIRKQTLANCERYITERLKELEEKILSAHEELIARENQLYDSLLTAVAAHTPRIQKTADAVSLLDVFAGFATLATDYQYCRPQITTGGEIVIRDGRHPVVEQILGSSQRFVANDCTMDKNSHLISVITGPNMAGKSTYIRQVALIVLLAQIGCFVPASSAVVGVVDGIFTRVGASDDLAAGQSTFMVEMMELANILKNATADSLLILDEVGRGTSTFDGMSIARAMLEYIADKKKLGAKTLFATHYHELTELETLLPCVKNYNTAVKKRGDDITFLRRIVPGAIDDSYGIEVSKLAGIPDWVIRRAHEILRDLEASRPVAERRAALKNARAPSSEQLQLPTVSAVEEALRKVDPDTLTPLEALNTLYEIKSML